MKIVDAQVHIWSSGTPTGQLIARCESYHGRGIAEGDGRGRRRRRADPPAVSWDPTSNALALEAARQISRPLRRDGPVPARRSGQPRADRRLAQPARHDGPALGRCCSRDQQNWPTDGTHRLDVAGRREGRPAGRHHGRPASCRKFRGIAEAIRGSADHRPFGLLRAEKDDAAFGNLDELLALAKLPNVAVKATGAPGYSTQPYPFKNLHDGLQRIFDAYGPSASSGAPTSPACRALPPVRDDVHRGAAVAERAGPGTVMGRGLCDWIGWKLPFDGC